MLNVRITARSQVTALAAAVLVSSLTLASCSSAPSTQTQGADTGTAGIPQTRTAGATPASVPAVATATALSGSPSDTLAGGSTPSASPSPSDAGSPGLVTYVEDLQQAENSDPDDGEGIAEVNGTSYQHSRAAQFCFGSNERKWVFVLERKYASLQGVIGLSDDSVATAKIRFEVLADGQLVYSHDLQVGQSVTLDVPVTNVLQLGLDTILLTQDGGCGAATGEWADIRVVS